MSDALKSMAVAEFLDLLASESPAPGGGSVAALAGAQAAALMAMVCRLTIGKKKYAAVEALVQTELPKLESYRQELLQLVDEDTAAFHAFAAAMILPKENEEQKAARQQALQTAAKAAAETPRRTIRAALAVARLIRQLHPVTNQNCLSDIGVAMQMARAAVLGAAMNVLINLPGTGDDAFNHEAAGEAKTAVHDVEGLAVETTRAVLASLG